MASATGYDTSSLTGLSEVDGVRKKDEEANYRFSVDMFFQNSPSANILLPMKASVVFRTSTIVSPLLPIAVGIYRFLGEFTFPQEWRDLLEWSGNGGLFTPETIPLPIGIGLIIFALLYFSNHIGLFFYWNRSRLIHLSLTIFGFCLQPFLGLTVSTPLETLGYELSIFLSGVVLTLAYFSSVAGKFERNPSREHRE